MPTVPRFVKACLAQPVDRIPVWIMRQAGRYLPEYRKLRGEYPFLTLCKTPALATEVTLQPLERFRMDAAILFSDILLLLEAMGVDLAFDEKAGPRLGRGESGDERVRSLSVPDPAQEMGYVLDAIRQIKGSIPEGCALIGFSGAPFTLATYLIEGGSSRDFYATKSFMYQEPAAFHRLMETLAEALELFLKAQIEAGVDAIQLFDTWAMILSPADYREFVLPHMQRLVAGLKDKGVPTIHFSLGTSTLYRDGRPEPRLEDRHRRGQGAVGTQQGGSGQPGSLCAVSAAGKARGKRPQGSGKRVPVAGLCLQPGARDSPEDPGGECGKTCGSGP